MTPSERIRNIKEISKALSKEEWPLIDLTLNQFGAPTTEAWGGNDKDNYVIDMISSNSDDKLIDLAKHLGIVSEIDSSVEPSFWKESETRLFISHLVEIKDKTAALASELEKLGFCTFVAHVDIEPTKEWQKEIELALSTMDAMVALISPNFINSRWCDQEVGIAIGRNIPVVPVKLNQDPYGFIGKYQALQGKGKTSIQLSSEIFDLLIEKPSIGQKLTTSLIKLLQTSESWADSKHLIGLIEKSKYITKSNLEEMKNAIDENSQVGNAWGVPDKIKELESRLG